MADVSMTFSDLER